MAPVVFAHGSRTSASMWRPQLAALSRAGLGGVAVDLPGHGTRIGEPFTLAGAVEAISAGVDRVGGQAIVVGHSLGGYCAIEHRAQHPEQVVGLVAAGCSARPDILLRRLWLVAARRIQALPDSGARLNQFAVDHLMSPEAGVDLAAGGFAVDTMVAILEEVGASNPVVSLAAAQSPVWLVSGRWDHFRLHERTFLHAARTGGAPARIVIVPRARHVVTLDQPVAFNRILLDAVGQVCAPAAWSNAAVG